MLFCCCLELYCIPFCLWTLPRKTIFAQALLSSLDTLVKNAIFTNKRSENHFNKEDHKPSNIFATTAHGFETINFWDFGSKSGFRLDRFEHFSKNLRMFGIWTSNRLNPISTDTIRWNRRPNRESLDCQNSKKCPIIKSTKVQKSENSILSFLCTS